MPSGTGTVKYVRCVLKRTGFVARREHVKSIINPINNHECDHNHHSVIKDDWRSSILSPTSYFFDSAPTANRNLFWISKQDDDDADWMIDWIGLDWIGLDWIGLDWIDHRIQ